MSINGPISSINGTYKSDIVANNYFKEDETLLEKRMMEASWRELTIASLPLLFFGIPVHLILFKEPISGGRKEWFKWIFSVDHPAFTVLTFILFIAGISINAFVIYNLYSILALLIKGEFDFVILENMTQVAQCIPILLPINFIWVNGHILRNLVVSLTTDFPRLLDDITETNVTTTNGNILSTNQMNNLSARWKLIGIYAIISFIHLTHIWLYEIRRRENLIGQESVSLHYTNYIIGPVFSTLIIPIYTSFSWAIQRQYIILKYYLKNLININQHDLNEKENIEMIHFHTFKLTFKDLSNRIQIINEIFEFYISFVIFWIIFSLASVELMDLQSITRYSTNSNRNLGGGNFPSIAENEEKLTTADTADTPDTADTSMINDSVELVRVLIFGLTALSFKIGLTRYLIWVAVGTNEEIRNLSIWLNDLVTQLRSDVSLNRYYAFRLLKCYVHSRIQEPLPALLRIYIAFNVMPFLQYRLNPIPIGQHR